MDFSKHLKIIKDMDEKIMNGEWWMMKNLRVFFQPGTFSIIEGEKKGKREMAIQAAITLKKKGIAVHVISETFGLSPEEIEKL